MKKVVHKAKHFKEAEEWDILQQIKMTPEERQDIALELRKRVYGKRSPDIRKVHRRKWRLLTFARPPNRLDLLNTIDGVSFQEAWSNKTTVHIRVQDNEVPVYFIGLDDLIRNKETLGRYKDLEDLKYLRKAREQD